MMGKGLKIEAFVLVLILFSFSALAGPVPSNQGVQKGEVPGKAGSQEAMTDIYDIKPPQAMGSPAWLRYGLPALGVILLCIAAALYFWRKKRRKENEPGLPPMSPEEAALARLMEIKDFSPAKGREFYFRLSEAFRGYVGDRFGIDALEKTTEELLPLIQHLNVPEHLAKQSKSFMISSDAVKFADEAADRERMALHYEFVLGFVESCTPVPTVTEQGIIDRPKG
jgi:hypothetical protein